MTTPEQARLEQLAYGRSTLRTSPDYQRPERSNTHRESYGREARPRLSSSSPRPGPKGHEAIVKAMQDNSQRATIVTAGGGEVFEGIVTGRDKFTITLMTAHPTDATRKVRRVFFKHAIEQFWGEEVPRRDINDTSRDEQGVDELRKLATAVK
jgi:sRNA-binding regulator protein Hfq